MNGVAGVLRGDFRAVVVIVGWERTHNHAVTEVSRTDG